MMSNLEYVKKQFIEKLTAPKKPGRVCNVLFVIDVTASMLFGSPSRIHTVNSVLRDFFHNMFGEKKTRSVLRIGFVCVAYDVVMCSDFLSYEDYTKISKEDMIYQNGYSSKQVAMKEDKISDGKKEYVYRYPQFSVIAQKYDDEGTYISKGVDFGIDMLQEAVKRVGDNGCFPSHLFLLSDGNANTKNKADLAPKEEDIRAARKMEHYRSMDKTKKEMIVPVIVGIGEKDDINFDVIRVYSNGRDDYIHITDGADKDGLESVRKLIIDTVKATTNNRR